MSETRAGDPAPGREERILEIIDTARGKVPRFGDERLTMAHGAGGKSTQSLIEGLIVPAFGSPALAELGDAGYVEHAGAGLALTTDSYVVRPLRFPGGSIGELAVNGTVNDLSVAGARPLALGLSLVLEEGLSADVLRDEVEAAAAAARAADVEVISGDTKVVERGHADGMYVTTSGIGARDSRGRPAPSALRPGDRVLLSKSIGEHGTAIMLARGDLGLEAEVRSDTRALWPVADALLGAAGADLRSMRDATRGGVASALNELARASRVGVEIDEGAIPVRPEVAAACELLGIDPMYMANEGVLVAIVDKDSASATLDELRAVPGCEDAAEIGRVVEGPAGMVVAETAFGGRRVVDLLAGDPLPRIC